MAYFLDAELAALTEGATRRFPQQRTSATAPESRRANKFGKSCAHCGTWVGAGKGYLDKKNGAWVVYCVTCP